MFFIYIHLHILLHYDIEIIKHTSRDFPSNFLSTSEESLLDVFDCGITFSVSPPIIILSIGLLLDEVDKVGEDLISKNDKNIISYAGIKYTQACTHTCLHTHIHAIIVSPYRTVLLPTFSYTVCLIITTYCITSDI